MIPQENNQPNPEYRIFYKTSDPVSSTTNDSGSPTN